MKALILAGDSSTGLRPVTNTSAKQLLPIANKPVLFYGLEAIREAGITNVGIVVGGTEAQIRDRVGDGSSFGLQVTYLQQDAPLGLAHAILIAGDYLGDDDFVFYLGDNFIVGGINSLVTTFRETKPDAQILLTKVPEPRSFGVAVLDATGRIIRLEEKPTHPKSDLALAGICMFSPAIHQSVRQVRPSRRNELELTDAIQWLIDGGFVVQSEIISGYWKDTGNVSDLLEANRTVLEAIEPRRLGTADAASELIGRIVLEAGAEVRGSRIIGPAIIGADTQVIDSYIGPFTSVADACLIANSEIEYSILLRGASIRGVGRIQGSLIGRDVEVAPAPGIVRAHRLVLGDHSTVQVSR